MKQFIIENKIFLGLYLVFLLAGAGIIGVYEKGAEILYLSSMHTPLLNEFFRRVTQMVELPVFFLILIVTIRFSYGKGVVLGLNCLVVFAVVEILKYLIFAGQVRPSVFFEGKAHLNFVQGMEIMREHSFPSGHTACAFALFFMLSLVTENKKWSVLFFALALLVGISRVYLLQHFFRDVYAGSFVGVFITAAFYLTFVRSEFYQNRKWKDKTLLRW